MTPRRVLSGRTNTRDKIGVVVIRSQGEENRYAAITCRSRNLGDDIQTIAALQYLSAAPKLLDRDRLDRVRCSIGTTYRTIMNGWFMYDPHHWPPAQCIEPLVISFHLTRNTGGLNKTGVSPLPHLLQGANREWFREITAKRIIGTRDLVTLEAFHGAGIDAEFSGCLTLTLQVPRQNVTDRILSIMYKANQAVTDKLRELTKIPVDDLKPVMPKRRIPGLAPRTKDKLQAARELLQRYSNAHAVVTDRLHVALPCLAAGTPVLFVHTDLADPRFGGLIDHVRAITPEDFLAGRFDFNFERPPANSDTWKPMAQRLRARCEQFVRESVVDRAPLSTHLGA